MTSISRVDKYGTVYHENKEGELHREDGPAVECKSYKAWYINGSIHRGDGPAYVDNVSEEWWVNGQRHREDGPAVRSAFERPQYWLNDRRYSKSAYDMVLTARKSGQEMIELKATLDQVEAIKRDAIVVIKGKKYKMVAVD